MPEPGKRYDHDQRLVQGRLRFLNQPTDFAGAVDLRRLQQIESIPFVGLYQSDAQTIGLCGRVAFDFPESDRLIEDCGRGGDELVDGSGGECFFCF